MKTIVIYTDGGARGNPGNAAIGIYAVDEENLEIFKKGIRIGVSTNNYAEYFAVITALEIILEDKINCEEILFFLDSLLIVNQLNGIYKVKDKKLILLNLTIKKLISKLNKKIIFNYIPRNKNKQADYLVNKALDKQ